MPSYKYIRTFGAALLAIVGVFVGFYSPHVLAATPVNAFPVGSEAVIANAVTWIITGLNTMTWVIFVFLSYLLDPNFIFNINEAGQSPFMDMLNQIWQLSRDLMNVAFAVLLVGAAIYTIVTANQEFIRQHIAKFIMAVILVNFSWFFSLVILDVANVAASTVYGIPSMLANQSNSLQCTVILEQKNSDSCAPIPGGTGFKCPCKRILDARWFVDNNFIDTVGATQAGENNPLPAPDAQYWTCFGNYMCLKYGPLDMKTVAGHSAILNGLIVNQARLGDLVRIPPPINANDVQQMIVFIIRQIIILMIHVALFFPLAALVLAFAIRIPVLWLTMAFMPFWFLSFVVTQGEITEYPNKIKDTFLKAAFLPAFVAIPFTIGFIMINAGSQLDGSFPWDQIQIPLLAQIGSFSELMWLLMSIGVIYLGVFMILQKMPQPLAWGAEAIKNTGMSLGRLALKAPLALPIIPGPGGGTSPLFMFKSLNPRVIEHGISGKQGIKGYLDELKNPGGSPARRANNASAADVLLKDPHKLDQLHKDLEALRTAVLSGKGDAELNQKLAEIKNNNGGVELSINNFKDDMNGLIDTMKKGNGDTKKLEDLRDKIADAINKRPPQPAAAPAQPQTPPNPPNPPAGNNPQPNPPPQGNNPPNNP